MKRLSKHSSTALTSNGFVDFCKLSSLRNGESYFFSVPPLAIVKNEHRKKNEAHDVNEEQKYGTETSKSDL